MRRSKWIGRLHLTTTRQAESAPRVDGCCCVVEERDDVTGETISKSFAKGYAIRYGRGSEAVVIAWRSQWAGCPVPPRTWLRMKRYHVLWMLKGRPNLTAGTSYDGPVAGDGSPTV